MALRLLRNNSPTPGAPAWSRRSFGGSGLHEARGFRPKNLAWLCNFRLSGPIIACVAAVFLLVYTCEQ
jgi:hypothetical protein